MPFSRISRLYGDGIYEGPFVRLALALPCNKNSLCGFRRTKSMTLWHLTSRGVLEKLQPLFSGKSSFHISPTLYQRKRQYSSLHWIILSLSPMTKPVMANISDIREEILTSQRLFSKITIHASFTPIPVSFLRELCCPPSLHSQRLAASWNWLEDKYLRW